MKLIDHCQQRKTKTLIGIIKGKGKLGGGIMGEVAVLRQRMYIQPAHNVHRFHFGVKFYLGVR